MLLISIDRRSIPASRLRRTRRVLPTFHTLISTEPSLHQQMKRLLLSIKAPPSTALSLCQRTRRAPLLFRLLLMVKNLTKDQQPPDSTLELPPTSLPFTRSRQSRFLMDPARLPVKGLRNILARELVRVLAKAQMRVMALLQTMKRRFRAPNARLKSLLL